MPIHLWRIDDRLLHGQVLVGWGGQLALDFYVVVDDPLAESAWEQDLYRTGAPEGVQVFFLSVPEALERLPELEGRSGRGALLTRETRTMRRLAESGLLEGRRVNVGGIHAAPGRRRALDYVYLGRAEEDDLREIRRRSAGVSARDLPTSPEVSFEELRHARDRA